MTDLFSPAQKPARIGLGTSISELEEFNRRAVIALKGVDFGSFNQTRSVFQTFERQIGIGIVSDKMQQAIYNIVHRYRRQITDQLVLAYAADRAKGSD